MQAVQSGQTRTHGSAYILVLTTNDKIEQQKVIYSLSVLQPLDDKDYFSFRIQHPN